MYNFLVPLPVLFFVHMVVGLAGNHPDPALIQPFLPASSPPTTIPAFPEQSDLTACPLDLPDALYSSVARACPASGRISRRRCCPTLAAWLYAAYARTALRPRRAVVGPASEAMPVLPDDSETCVEQLGRALGGKGVELPRPNGTCDLVYCYCGVRLHSLSCPTAFRVSDDGRIAAGWKVRQLEKNCRFGARGNQSRPACNKCLHTLYQLNEENFVNKTADNGDVGGSRKTKMKSRDCQLMGLTWLLATDRSAYMPAVTQILSAFMASGNGSGSTSTSQPHSCSLASDDMPYAVGSAELGEQSSSTVLGRPYPFHLYRLVVIVLASFLFQCLF